MKTKRKLLDSVRNILNQRKNRDATYEIFTSSRRFRIVKSVIKNAMKVNAACGYGNVSFGTNIRYPSSDLYSDNFIFLSDKEFEYLKQYYESLGFEVSIYCSDSSGNQSLKYDTLIIIWDKTVYTEKETA